MAEGHNEREARKAHAIEAIRSTDHLKSTVKGSESLTLVKFST